MTLKVHATYFIAVAFVRCEYAIGLFLPKILGILTTQYAKDDFVILSCFCLLEVRFNSREVRFNSREVRFNEPPIEFFSFLIAIAFYQLQRGYEINKSQCAVFIYT